MNEAIDRLLWERQRLDRGLPATALASLAAHLGLAGLAVGLPLLLPQEPPLQVAPGFMVALPRGGGGSPAARAAGRGPRPAAGARRKRRRRRRPRSSSRRPRSPGPGRFPCPTLAAPPSAP